MLKRLSRRYLTLVVNRWLTVEKEAMAKVDENYMCISVFIFYSYDVVEHDKA